MNGFRRRRGVITEHFSEFEAGLLASLVEQLISIVAAPEPSGDPLQDWAAAVDADELDRSDPVVARLFPDAYADADANREFRRFSEADLRSGKAEDARVVAAALARTEKGLHPVRLAGHEVDPWLRTLNALRLSVAMRLDIQTSADADALDEVPEDDPRAFLVDVYEWLGFALETLIQCVTPDA